MLKHVKNFPLSLTLRYLRVKDSLITRFVNETRRTVEKIHIDEANKRANVFVMEIFCPNSYNKNFTKDVNLASQIVTPIVV